MIYQMINTNEMINANMKNMELWTITGLIDAEGSFIVNITKDETRKLGYVVSVSMEMGMNYKDKKLLDNIRSTLKVGNIYYNQHDYTYKWKVSNVDDLSNVIIPHLQTHYLLSQKRTDFEIFTKIIEIIKLKNHLTAHGLQEVVNLKASLNLGLSDKLKISFPKTVVSPRTTVVFEAIPDPNWLCGFAEGEACFYVSVYKSAKSKLGLAVQLVFKITQHSRDKQLLKGIANFFNCGRVENRSLEACDFTITSLKLIEEKIIPFFEMCPLRGHKLLDFEDFNRVVKIMKTKHHLTSEGMKMVMSIKAGMNTKRI